MGIVSLAFFEVHFIREILCNIQVIINPLLRFLCERMDELLVLIMTEENANFATRVLPVVRLIMAEGTALVIHCIADGQQGLERLFQNRLVLLSSTIIMHIIIFVFC